MTGEEKNRILAAALDKFSFTPKAKKEDPITHLLAKSKAVTNRVRDSIKPLLAAGGWKDQAALQDVIQKLYVDSFWHFDREELLLLVVILHTSIMMQSVADSPWGSETPDLLSGQ